MLAGIAYLCGTYEIGATPPGKTGFQSILSQLTAAVIGRGFFYYVTIGSVLVVLALSANTGFADFPRLCRVIALDGFLPSGFAHRGRRLVYSQGILVLADAGRWNLDRLRRDHRSFDPALRGRGVPGVHAVAGGDGRALEADPGSSLAEIDGRQRRRGGLHGGDTGRRAGLEVSRGRLGDVSAGAGAAFHLLRSEESLPGDRPRAGHGRAARCRAPRAHRSCYCRCGAGA